MSPDAALAAVTSPAASRYSMVVTRDPLDVLAAQRLRAQVLGAEWGVPLGAFDQDRFDDHCDHLLVRDDLSGAVVGTYRLLPPQRSAAGLYSAEEFDLTALDPLRPGLVEAGRSCVHPDHRNGAVVGLVWSGIARYLDEHGHRWLAGCASVPLDDGGALAARVWDAVSRRHYAPPRHRVHPHREFRPGPTTARGPLPPLLRGYLRLGAQVCGRPAHDEEFGVADFFVLLDFAAVDHRYLRYWGVAG
ncbi:GNAT family N-acetyltransferase [Saccharopolyspora cebuensis]|uniref:GNAT family N-acetyltransferase n=1 Tax=Saccharopolyspora cebuensis TaxID=418759 RepID=A0ABV4CCE4_9PSEU